MTSGCATDATPRNENRPRGSDNPMTRDQRLIVAAFQLEAGVVHKLLSEGADVATRFDAVGNKVFVDEWTLGWPIAHPRWTPLIALASSNRYPDPDQPTGNSSEARDDALRRRAEIPPNLIAERDRRRLEIAKLLIEHKAPLDADDGYGATALYNAIYNDYEDLALLIIEAGAEVNVKVGVYIDGDSDITALHRATENPRLVKALLERGANPRAADSSGDTPLHWATLDRTFQSVKLLVEAGADVNARNEEGRTPIAWLYKQDDDDHRKIRDYLREAGAQEAGD